MSLDRRYYPRRGIMLSTFKSISQLDTTNHESSVQSPNYRSKGGISIYSAINNQTPKQSFKDKNESYDWNQRSIQEQSSFNKTLEGPFKRKRSYRRSIQSISYQKIKQNDKSSKQITNDTHETPKHNNILSQTFDFVLNNSPKTIKSINMTKTQLRRLIYGRKPHSRTESKKQKIYLCSNKQNIQTSANQQNIIRKLSYKNINIEVQTCHGYSKKISVNVNDHPEQIVNQLKDEYLLSASTFKQLLNLIEKQRAHLNKFSQVSKHC